MSFISINSAFISGLRAKFVKVECDIGKGINSFSIIGLGDKAIEESKDRVCSALRNSQHSNPQQINKKTTISLAPGDIKKEGTNFDLPIAIAYLVANKEIIVNLEELNESMFIGELSLKGELTKLKGVLAITELAEMNHIKNLFLPKENIEEARLIKNINIYGASSMQEVVQHLLGVKKIKKTESLAIETFLSTKTAKKSSVDMSDVKGQVAAKRALLIAISGGHNIVLYGPPGTGKTMLAKASQALLPPLDYQDILEVTRIYSITGLNHL